MEIFYHRNFLRIWLFNLRYFSLQRKCEDGSKIFSRNLTIFAIIAALASLTSLEKIVVNVYGNVLTKRVFIAVSLMCLTACQTLPNSPHLAKSQSLSPTLTDSLAKNTLIQRISRTNNPKPAELSGYYPLIASSDAFAARSVLTQLSSQRIDVQYYIWHNDTAGQLMLKDLYNAANRGVKVRLLLDDLNTNPQIDQQLLAFAQHPNIAVRLINPKNVRAITSANFITALPRYHRRMHNKSMTFDNQLSIIGGRNIGDEYLRSDIETVFLDLDVLLAGKVVQSVSQSFEQYWQSPIAYDIETLVKPANNLNKNQTDEPFLDTLTKLAPYAVDSKISKSSQLYHLAAGAVIDRQLLDKKVGFRWYPMTFVADNVAKLQRQDQPDERLVAQLRELIGTPKRQFSIVSSYFVPSPLGIAELNQLANDGVNVQVLTNSYASTDVPIVHSGYGVARQALVKAGVTLYELKPNVDPDFRQKKRRLARNKISTSLHTKAFAVDDTVAFIGSYNVDPRSANINTELGVLIFDPLLAKSIHASFEDLLLISHRVSLGDNQKVVWQTQNPTTSASTDKNVLTTETTEPKVSWSNRLWLKLFGFLPINWQL